MHLISKSDKVFIAGSSGMVGSAILRKLKKESFENILVPKRDEINLENFNEVKTWFEEYKPDIVIFCAAKVGGIFANSTKPAEFILENLKIQNNVLENSYKTGTKRFLFLGSSCIYPKNADQPIKEEYLLSGNLEETNEWYAIAKIAGIKLCQALRYQYGFDAISLMPTNLYGPGDNYNYLDSHVLPALVRKFWEAKNSLSNQVSCWGSGNPMREFLHVDDLANACYFALKSWDPESKNTPLDEKGNPLLVLNVGSGIEISIKELAYMISEQMGYEGKIIWDTSKPDGMMRKLLDTSKMTKLGWSSEITIKEGLKKTILDFETNYKIKKARI